MHSIRVYVCVYNTCVCVRWARMHLSVWFVLSCVHACMCVRYARVLCVCTRLHVRAFVRYVKRVRHMLYRLIVFFYILKVPKAEKKQRRKSRVIMLVFSSDAATVNLKKARLDVYSPSHSFNIS